MLIGIQISLLNLTGISGLYKIKINPNKIVIAPKKWFANHKLENKDIIPKKWIRI